MSRFKQKTQNDISFVFLFYSFTWKCSKVISIGGSNLSTTGVSERASIGPLISVSVALKHIGGFYNTNNSIETVLKLR